MTWHGPLAVQQKRQTLSWRRRRPMAPITTITTPMQTIAPGPTCDQSMSRCIVGLAMISPAKSIAPSRTTMGEALGPLGRAGALTAGGVTLSWIGLPAGLGAVTGVLSSIVLLLHHCELSDADCGIDHDFGWRSEERRV